MSDVAGKLPEWVDMLRALEPVGGRLIEGWGRSEVTAEDRQQMHKLALSALANGYLTHVDMDPARPQIAPAWNVAMNLAGPNPDYIYKTCEIDARGTYQITGYRGTTRFYEFTQQYWVMIGGAEGPGPAPTTNDLDQLQLSPDGWFSVILSPERPAGYDGDWWRLQPGVVRILVRECICDWRNEICARVAINRLDEAAPVDHADQARRLSNMADWVRNVVQFDVDLARFYREHHGTNVLTRSKKIDSLGGLPEQLYYDGAYEIDDDEALVVEIDLPRQSRYWQILVADDRFSTVDWINRQSSLNDVQARLDPDGKFRLVVSHGDPGVHNWLDKADNKWGNLQARFNRASNAPEPVVTRVKLADARAHLPKDTPVVTPAERKVLLRQRREAAQLRSLW